MVHARHPTDESPRGAGFPVTPRLPRQGLAPTPAAGRGCGTGGRAQPQAHTVTDAATRGDPGPPLGPLLQSELLAAAASRALVPCGRRRAVRGRGRSGQPRAGRWPGRPLCYRPPSSGLRPPPSRLCRRVRIQERICAEDISHCPPTARWPAHREGITPATQVVSVWASACPHRGGGGWPVPLPEPGRRPPARRRARASLTGDKVNSQTPPCGL